MAIVRHIGILTGQSFDKRSKALGGKLQALFEMRDGNNNETFEGKATGTAGSKTLTVTDVNDLGNSLLKLDIPASDGVITLGNATYNYKSFTATVDADGNYTMELELRFEALMTEKEAEEEKAKKKG